jgi:hypothetical protein
MALQQLHAVFTHGVVVGGVADPVVLALDPRRGRRGDQSKIEGHRRRAVVELPDQRSYRVRPGHGIAIRGKEPLVGERRTHVRDDHGRVIRDFRLLLAAQLVVEEASTYLADNDGDSDEARTLRPLQAAACTYRIAIGPRAGQKLLTVQGAIPREEGLKQMLCADIDGFSLPVAGHCKRPDAAQP